MSASSSPSAPGTPGTPGTPGGVVLDRERPGEVVEEDGWTLRPFRSLAEYRACVALQEEVWGDGFSERVPVAILKVSRYLGGVVAGAWDREGTLQGFVYGMTGPWEAWEGRTVHWSDMLAVRMGRRNAGLGMRLKAYQRRVLLDRGVTTTLWTFDPLESKNARLNLTKLGATARGYVPDMYGETDSPLHRGIGTDRFVAWWQMDGFRAVERTGGRPGPGRLDDLPAALPRAFDADRRGGLPRPEREDAGPPDAPSFLVPIPGDLHELKDRDAGLAGAWRRATRAVLAPAVERGWEATELLRDGAVSWYVMTRRASPDFPGSPDSPHLPDPPTDDGRP